MKVTDDSRIYAAYLSAYATTRSKGQLSEWLVTDEELLAARAMGSNDGADEQMLPADKWQVLEMVQSLIHAEKPPEKAETACKVVPMDDGKSAS